MLEFSMHTKADGLALCLVGLMCIFIVKAISGGGGPLAQVVINILKDEGCKKVYM